MNYKRLGYRKRKLAFFIRDIKKIFTRPKKCNSKFIISSFALLVFMLIGLIIPKDIKAYSENGYRNEFYVKILNYTIPFIKVSSYNENEEEKQGSIKDEILSVLGLDTADPLSIIKKEVPFLYKNDYTIGDKSTPKNKDDSPKQVINDEKSDGSEGNNGICINPFKLSNDQISKIDEKKSTDNLGSNTVATVFDPKLKKNLNKFKPEVLIYHTHACESFLPGKDRKTDVEGNICAVGDVLAKELEVNYGISVIHDKTYHDLNDYPASYRKSRGTLEKYLKQYGDFKLIIDMHRDGVEDNRSFIAKFNGENVARVKFVMPTKNPHFDKNMIHVNKMIEVGNRLYPGIMRGNGVDLSRQWGIKFYNQDKSNNAVLIEVGTHTNTLNEAKNTQKYLARIIAEALK